MQNLTFCDNEVFFFSVNLIIIFVSFAKIKTGLFLNDQKFQTEKYLGIYKQVTLFIMG